MKCFYLLILACFVSMTLSAQKKLEAEGGKEEKSVSIKMKDNKPSSRIIIESTYPLVYKSNMGDVSVENIARGVANGINVDTIYFYLNADDNKRVITISSDGYSSVKLNVQLLPKETYRYLVFDPNEKYTYQGNYDKGVEFFVMGNYVEALKSFTNAQKCEDVPTESDIEERIATVKKVAKYSHNAKALFEKAEKLRMTPNRVLNSNTDSVTYYHNLAKRFRNEVLKLNNTDAYCLKYNEEYETILPQIDRVVTGKVVDNLNQSIPIANVTIYGTTEYGQTEKLGESASDGTFSIWVNGKYDAISFCPENNPNYQKPYNQKLELGQHYKLFIKLAPKKR